MARSKQSKRDGTADLASPARRSANARSASPVTTAFFECSAALKRFLSGFLRVPQDIEDVAQEAYLRAYVAEQRESIDQPTPFLFRVAKNLALTRLTRKSRQITDYIEDAGASVVMQTAPGTDEELEAQQWLGVYCEAIASLPPKCRQIFLLRKVHGLTHSEIGERMNLSVSSVEKHLHQGILFCRTYLESHEGVSKRSAGQTRRGRGKISS
jgi:RNA polymerase sigma factor (sigma-70 family)